MVKWNNIENKKPPVNKRILGCFETINHPCAGNKKIQDTHYHKMDNCDLMVFSEENSYLKLTHWADINLPTAKGGE